MTGLSSDPTSNRRDFLTYALSLMRAHNAEHSNSLPVLDVSAMKHVAYVFDSLIYFMTAGDMSDEVGMVKDVSVDGHFAYDDEDDIKDKPGMKEKTWDFYKLLFKCTSCLLFSFPADGD